MFLRSALDHLQPFSPEQFGSLLDLLSPELLSACLQKSGTVTLRKCRLPLDMMVWNVVGMVLPGNHTARQCLGEAPVREVFEQT